MNRLLITCLTVLLLGCQSVTPGDEDMNQFASADGIIGSVLSLNTEFDMYRVRKGPRSDASYEYGIMPAPEIGMRGQFWTYLGRIPAGTRVEIASVKKKARSEWIGYQVKLLSPISENIQENSDRKVEDVGVPLESQVFWISHIADGVGIYEKPHSPDGIPRLNTIWFSQVSLKE